MSLSFPAGHMSAAASPSPKTSLKREAEESQSGNEAAEKKLKNKDSIRYLRHRH